MSVLEVARIAVQDGSQERFEDAFGQALGYVRSADGHLRSELVRSTVKPTEYTFLVTWRALEDHTERFASSSAFAAFGELISPFLDGAPDVQHYQKL